MPAPPYDVLARVYDDVMDHVDYDRWARYVHHCLETHAEQPVRSLLELAGGTGSMAVRLQPMGPGEGYRYWLTDGSEAMVERARAKVAEAGRPIECRQAEFADVSLDALGRDEPFDAVVCVYDGLNYLLDLDAVTDLFRRIAEVLRPGGLAVVDQSTPANSEDNESAFVDEGRVGGLSYVRRSRYDAAARLHRTTFEIEGTWRGESVRAQEEHVQRAYTPQQIRSCIAETPLEVVAAYDGFTLDSADAQSHRVHWALRRGTRFGGRG